MNRRTIFVASGMALLGLAASTLPFAPRLIWNASASVPIGLYVLRPVDVPQIGDLLAIQPPPGIAAFIAKRGYTAPSVPLLKRVAAVPGQRICRHGTRITVDAQLVGDALQQDRRGRAMPRWQGCRILAPGRLFLMNANIRDSLDGRYFGPLSAGTVLGRAEPVWQPGIATSAQSTHPSPATTGDTP